MLLLAYVIEFYCLTLIRFPILTTLFGLQEVKGDLATLQPALFNVIMHVVATDAAARKPVEEGGIGYKGPYTTLELMADQVRIWNKEHEGRKKTRRDSTRAKLRDELKNLGTASAAVKA
jgi:hypothetical protein